MDDEVLLGVATPCMCGASNWPHDCVWDRLQTVLDQQSEPVARVVLASWEACLRRHSSEAQHLLDCIGLLPPCEVCGASGWPAGGMDAARAIHMRDHERRGEVSNG